MEIFFDDPQNIPVPRDEVRIREFNGQLYPDGRRLRVYLEVTPFQARPDAEITLLNADQEIMASASVIETINPKMEMTLHVPGSAPGGDYILNAVVFYRIELPADDPEDEETPVQYETLVVDRAEFPVLLA